MIVSAMFDSLVTFDCVYGGFELENGVVRLYVERGLALKKTKLVTAADGARIVQCDEDECPKGESIFPVHYIYDPARDLEYVEWSLVNGLLHARSEGGEWVRYESKSEGLHAMHEYVGDCWLVFSGVSVLRKVIYEYSLDRKSSSGNEFVEEFISGPKVDKSASEYFLEGEINVLPGPGWMSLKIDADSFHIEIPDD